MMGICMRENGKSIIMLVRISPSKASWQYLYILSGSGKVRKKVKIDGV
jgi:hypothetical protein